MPSRPPQPGRAPAASAAGGYVWRGAGSALILASLLAPLSLRADPVPLPLTVLEAVDAIPAHVAGVFEEPLTFQRLPGGRYLVFDRRAHAVYAIDAARTQATRLVEIGQEAGRVIQPTAFDLDASGSFVVADAPNRRERIQRFDADGVRLGGFSLPGRASARLVFGSMVLSGVGSLQYTGRSVLINQPETGALITEYGLRGTPVRTIGRLRPTGHERDRDLHLALNTGLPLVNPRGGFYFVFQTGEPRFRRYDARGRLMYERVVQGREIDPLLSAMPQAWPTRTTHGEELPNVPPVVRTAAVDPTGRLWIAFVVPFTYVYDDGGDKIRTVQFKGAGIVTPSSLFFDGDTRLLVAPGLYAFRVP